MAYEIEETRYDRPYRPPSPIGGDLDAYDNFSFMFPKVEASKDGELSDMDSPGVDSDSAQREDRDSQRQSTAKGVFNARYTGSAELGGSHTATLVDLDDPKRKKRPLYKWL